MKAEASQLPLSPAVRAEAAVWVARLHSSDRSRALESGLRKWLKADPAHARAFELATEAWEIGGAVPGAAVPRMADPFVERIPERRAPPTYLAIAAMCLMAMGILFFVKHTDPAVTTSVGEQRMLTLEDGTRIFLNTDTRLVVQEDAARRHVQLESGEAMFDVAKDPHRPFVVTAGDKQVIALGTSFVVRRESEQLTVTLIEGKVVVSPTAVARADIPQTPLAGETVLAPGQRLTLVSSKVAKLDEPVLEEVTGWRRGEVILDNTRLQDAVEEMNRYSTVKLVISDAAAADIRISGIFRAGDSASFAQAVAETYKLGVDHQPRRILISSSGPEA
jgi:transmembrane sensor